MGKDVGIDLGTATVQVFVKGKGIVINEPSVVAVNRKTDKILCYGNEAYRLIGKSPLNIQTVRPLRDGVISQYDITQQMIKYFLKRACGTMIFHPTVLVCIPSGITEVEEKAVLDAATQAGAKKTFLIEEPVAAAIGAGIDINLPNGNMVVDIGGGTTDIAVISLGGVVVSESIKCAGDRFDDAIIRYIRRKHNVQIGERSAEEIKKRIGNVWTIDNGKYMDVKGKCLTNGLPQVVRFYQSEVQDALEEPLDDIIDAVCSVVEHTPPELVGDVLNNGIVMTGGGSLLKGLDKLITRVTGIKTRVATDADKCVAVGTGKALLKLSALSEGALNLQRNRQQRL